MKLRHIAYARSGDKGSDLNIGVIAYDHAGYLHLEKCLTKERVQLFLSSLTPTEVIRYELPNLLALNFIIKKGLSGGASRSLRLDSQGKALGQVLLEIEIPDLEC